MAVQPHDQRSAVAQEKAAVLREALPWITRFHGQTVVIKYGGNAMVDEELKRSFAADVALLHFVGLRPVIVHGGGPQIGQLAAQMGLTSRFVGGLRVTDAAMMDVVRMALLGQVNPEVVGLVQDAGAPSVGVAGTDAGLLQVRPAVGPEGEDLGFVGEVEHVDTSYLTELLEGEFLPVVATVGRDAGGVERNVNADLAAGAIAAALGASKFVCLTDVPGLYQDFGRDEQSLMSEVSVKQLQHMLAADELHAGMRPKIRSIVDAVRGGVPQAHILDGRVLHAVLIEIFTDEGVGTMVTTGGETLRDAFEERAADQVRGLASGGVA
ncbi:acetylglutamate kinase [Nitriliruptor alkaliphilus]|uniref:acetylglutamate kinase n=1 Tax=Nitriliruptor alkaliphilus TaxID=427918 RepID=UPI0009F87246|nr:acetylglutamate kinase [Nitriliruptor alkaliphilus]